MAERRIAVEILSRRDPHGFIVIPAKPEAKELLDKMGVTRDKNNRIVETVDLLLVRVKSKSLAERIIRVLYRKNLLALIDEED